MDRMAAEGYDDQPVTRSEIELLLNRISRRAAESGTWHAMILFSPTDWTDEADFVLGKGGRAFHDRLVSVVLFEQGAGRFLFNPTDEKLLSLQEAFSMDLDEATFAKARQFVEDYFVVHNSLSLDTLVHELGLSRKAGIRVFKLLAAGGKYGVETLEEVGMVLTHIS